MPRKTVLVADDSKDLQALFAIVVGMGGHMAITANNGAEAIEKAFRYQPDLILMDISMPEMDGCEAARRILSMPRLSNIPIVAISGNCGDDWERQALDAGCIECVNKPVIPSQLHDIIGRYIEHC
jgi:CheY-like chemotaxis protein